MNENRSHDSEIENEIDGEHGKDRDIDRMEFRFPFGGGFSVSGRNASKFFWAAGAIGIIIALGWAVANVIGAFRDVPGSDLPASIPDVPSVGIGRGNKNYLPRWSSPESETTEVSLPAFGISDCQHCVLFGNDWIPNQFSHGEVNPSEG